LKKLLILIVLGGLAALMAETPAPLLVVQEEFWNGDRVNDVPSKTVPAGWVFFGQNTDKGGLDTNVFRSADKSLKVPATASGECGYNNHILPIVDAKRALTLSLFYNVSADYAGNTPYLAVNYFDDKDQLIKTQKYPLAVTEKGKFVNFTCQLNDQVPAGAKKFQLALTSKADGTTGTGAVYFDSIQVVLAPSAGTLAMLRGVNDGNWYKMGEAVGFKVNGKLPEGSTKLIGSVYDSTGVLVKKVESASELWSWRPEAPGFYQVAFAAVTPAGEIPLVEEFTERAWVNNIAAVYPMDKVNVVVVSDAKRDTRNLMGYQLDCFKGSQKAYGDRQVKTAAMLGGSWARMHVQWNEVEPEKGKYDWTFLDYYVDKCVENNLQPVVGFFGTPKWASGKPDDMRYLICVWGYTAWAPKDMADWENFVTALVNRYKDRVNTWEVWNEPHLPGFSCFWVDTPEKYTELLQRAYAVIKKNQPKSDVWIGGIGMRYLPFYDRIIEMGAGKSFDTLALHGHGVNPNEFFAIDKKYNSPTHKWANSEWHASLLRWGDGTYKLTENMRNIRMLIDLLKQINFGVTKIAFFETYNLVEKESLELYSVRGKEPMAHTSGLFRRKPYIQPMLGAAVMYQFSGLVGENAKVTGEYWFGKQKAVGVASDAGKIIVVWQETDAPQKLNDELAAIVKGKSITSWDGKNWQSDDLLQPNVMYFVRDAEIPASRKADKGVLAIGRQKLTLAGPKGNYGSKPLISDAGKLIFDNAQWMTTDWQKDLADGQTLPERKPKFAMSIAGNNLELVVDAPDDKHNQPNSGFKMYEGDGLQFAFDTAGEGYYADAIEFQMALTPKGPELLKQTSPSLVGDIPTNWTAAGLTVKTAKMWVERTDSRTRYLIQIPLTELYPMVVKAGQPLRFSLLINENDGTKRVGYYRWGDGIGKDKDPVYYGTLR